jgi:hypothetical protein
MLADHLPALLAAASIQAVGALSPGPAVALVAGVALERGRRPALATAWASRSDRPCWRSPWSWASPPS